jgi:proline racemase
MKLAVDAVDAHVEGQHGRVIVGGVGILDVPGSTMFEKMTYFEQHLDWFRKLMIREPRGFPRACANVLLPPTQPGCDAGFVILEQPDLYAAMSGTNTMIVATVMLEEGMLPLREPLTTLTLEPPAGPIPVRAHCEAGRVTLVEIDNVASFATAVDVPIDVPGYGTVPVSVAWGGMAFAVVDGRELGVEVSPDRAREVQQAAIAVCGAARAQIGFSHPLEPGLSEVEGTVVLSPPRDPSNDARQTACLPSGQMDTSPSGTGSAAAMAVRFARGTLAAAGEYRAEGYFGGVFRCSVVEVVDVGGIPAIVPRIGGRAWITGYARYVLQEGDPFPEGFILGDLWPAANAGSDSAALSAALRSGRELDSE